MEKSDLQLLEIKIDELVNICKQLTEENRSLRENQAHLKSANTALLEKNTLACTRIEAMIARLNAMEVNT